MKYNDVTKKRESGSNLPEGRLLAPQEQKSESSAQGH